jgi:pyruvate/2-oxoglutarate dehydrogenase complex dihydrolipoamide acyltransferase (E2) component
MPKLGAEITTGRIEEWKKKEGEWVEEKDKVCHFFQVDSEILSKK